jgi:hypothetical protein
MDDEDPVVVNVKLTPGLLSQPPYLLDGLSITRGGGDWTCLYVQT